MWSWCALSRQLLDVKSMFGVLTYEQATAVHALVKRSQSYSVSTSFCQCDSAQMSVIMQQSIFWIMLHDPK